MFNHFQAPVSFGSSYTSEPLIPREQAVPETEVRKECILIDSYDRNFNLYKSPYYFKVNFDASSTDDAFVDKLFRNVSGIEIQDFVGPDSLSTHRYLILDIEELNTTFRGTSSTARNAFAILIPDFSSSNGNFVNFRVKTSSCNCFKEFNPPINLSRLTFTLYPPNIDRGEYFDSAFFTGSKEVEKDVNNQISFTLNIKYLMKKNDLKFHIT